MDTQSHAYRNGSTHPHKHTHSTRKHIKGKLMHTQAQHEHNKLKQLTRSITTSWRHLSPLQQLMSSRLPGCYNEVAISTGEKKGGSHEMREKKQSTGAKEKERRGGGGEEKRGMNMREEIKKKGENE